MLTTDMDKFYLSLVLRSKNLATFPDISPDGAKLRRPGAVHREDARRDLLRRRGRDTERGRRVRDIRRGVRRGVERRVGPDVLGGAPVSPVGPQADGPYGRRRRSLRQESYYRVRVIHLLD